jgi:hypothetical protein
VKAAKSGQLVERASLSTKNFGRREQRTDTMIKISVFLLTILTAVGAMGALDLSEFDLTEKQKALIERLEKRGLKQDDLLKFAASLHRSNQPAVLPYIPVHTPAQLDAVTEWAVGGAFYSFAKDASVKFDRERFMADCPNAELFFFGKASATEFLKRDVLSLYLNGMYMLNLYLAKDPAGFKAFYLEQIEKMGFQKYLIE